MTCIPGLLLYHHHMYANLLHRSKTIITLSRHKAPVTSMLARYLRHDVTIEERVLAPEVFQRSVADALFNVPNNPEESNSVPCNDDELSFNDVFDCAATEEDDCTFSKHRLTSATRFYSPILCAPVRKDYTYATQKNASSA